MMTKHNHLSFLRFLFMLLVCATIGCFNSSCGVDAAESSSSSYYKMRYPCTIISRDGQAKDETRETSYDCELNSLDANGVKGLRIGLVDSNDNPISTNDATGIFGDSISTIVSGQTKLLPFDETNIQGDVSNDNNWILITTDENGLPTTAKLPSSQTPQLEQTSSGSTTRTLQSSATASKATGTKTVLVVRIETSDSQSTITKEDIRDNVFGTNGDVVNLKSQLEACSYGKSTVQPATSSSSPYIDNGVVEVLLPTANAVGNDPRSLMNSVTADLAFKKNIYLEDYDHVMVSTKVKIARLAS